MFADQALSGQKAAVYHVMEESRRPMSVRDIYQTLVSTHRLCVSPQPPVNAFSFVVREGAERDYMDRIHRAALRLDQLERVPGATPVQFQIRSTG